MTEENNNLPEPFKTEGKAIQLHDSGLKAGSLIEKSLSGLNREQANNLMEKAAQEALRLEVKAREQHHDYVTGKQAIDDHVNTFGLIDKGGKLTRHVITSDIKTGAGNMRIESKSGGTCFVASVAYGDPNHPDVVFLRKFRDDVLTKSKIGVVFIDWYWKNGPRLARIVGRYSLLKFFSRLLIGRLISIIRVVLKRL